MAQDPALPTLSGVSSPQISSKHRGPIPSLSTEQLRSAQSVFQSNITSPSSLFLSPPLSDHRTSSPPPRPDAEDYLAARKRHRQKNKFRAGHGRRHYNTKEDSEEMTSPRHPLLSESYTFESQDNYCESCTSKSDASDMTDVSNTLSTRQPTNPRKREYSQESMKPLPLQTFGSSAGLIHPVLNMTESPAANALRRLSQTGTTESSSEPSIGRRLSETVAATLGGFRPRLVDSKSRRSKNNLLPATIRVRKASAAPGLKTTSGPASVILHGSDPDAPQSSQKSDDSTPQLVAFRSTSLAVVDTDTPSPNTNPEEQSTVTRVSAGSSGKENQDRRKSLFPFEGSVKSPRSTTADTAVTLTDVHVAPGTFSVDPRSRKASIASRRLSVVQVMSRKSVHEIVWREDESTSDSGSSKMISPKRDELSSRVASIIEEDQMIASKRSRSTSLKDNGLPGLDLGPSFGVDENLLQWSWEMSSPSPGSSEPDNKLQSARPEWKCSHDMEEASSSRTLKRKDRQSSVSAISSVQSFPPLGDRRSTAEWRQTPRADLNVPFAGRRKQLRAHANTGFDGQGDMQAVIMGWAANQRGTKMRKLGSHPYAPARIMVSGKVGSSVGASSHQMVYGGRLSA